MWKCRIKFITFMTNTNVRLLKVSVFLVLVREQLFSPWHIESKQTILVCFLDLDNKPKRLLRNIPAQHLYLRMATTDDEIVDQLEKIKAVELQHLFLASSNVHAERYLGMVYLRKILNDNHFLDDYFVIIIIGQWWNYKCWHMKLTGWTINLQVVKCYNWYWENCISHSDQIS